MSSRTLYPISAVSAIVQVQWRNVITTDGLADWLKEEEEEGKEIAKAADSVFLAPSFSHHCLNSLASLFDGNDARTHHHQHHHQHHCSLQMKMKRFAVTDSTSCIAVAVDEEECDARERERNKK